MDKGLAVAILALNCFALAVSPSCSAERSAPATDSQIARAEKVIIDTDIGDDIDDAFAVALALRSPELEILGITTTFGDTESRARLLDRLLGEAGRADIPVAAGPPTAPKTTFTQLRYAQGGRFARASHPDAIHFLLDEIRRNPGEVTLLAIGPLVNVGAAMDKDADTFRKLKRVVMMGGSIYRGYGDLALTLLYHQWGQETPTLFDPMTIAFIVKPELCPVEPMLVRVDEQGYTRPVEAPKSGNSSGSPVSATGTSAEGAAFAPNAQVCLKSNPDDFFHFLVPRLAAP
jgi:inosine-uridine nucleoside N-ribohydrolase